MEEKGQIEKTTGLPEKAHRFHAAEWRVRARRTWRVAALFFRRRVWRPTKRLLRAAGEATKRRAKWLVRASWIFVRREVWRPSRRWIQITYTESKPRLVQGLRDARDQAAAFSRHALAFWRAHRPAFLNDPVAVRVLVLAAGLNLAVWGWLALLYSSLPPFVPLHFDAAGNPDRIVVRREVFTLPAIGLVVFLANTSLGGALYRRLPFASYVLFGGATLVQSLLLVTVWHLLVNWG